MIPPAAFAPAVCLLAALVCALVRSWRAGTWISMAGALAAFALVCAGMARGVPANEAALLTGFAGLLAAVASRGFVAQAIAAGRLRPRAYHVAFQWILGFTLLAELAPSRAVATLALEAAALAFAYAGTLNGGTAALRTRFIPAAAASLLVLLGIGLPPGDAAIACLLAGQAALAGLAPLHLWLLRARSRGPWPVGLMLGLALGDAALLPLLRLAAVPGFAGAALLAFGLLSVLAGGAGMWRSADARRFLAWAAVLETGVSVTMFGLGPQAVPAGLLHMVLSTLVLLAAALSAGRPVFWTLSLLALAGLPGGLFTSESLAVTAAIHATAWVAVPLLAGLALGTGAALRRIGAPGPQAAPLAAGMLAAASLGAAVVVGLVLPVALAGAPG